MGLSEATGKREPAGVACDPADRDTSSETVCTSGDRLCTTQRTGGGSGAHQATHAGAPCTTLRTSCDSSGPDAPPTVTQRTTTRTSAPHRNGDTAMTADRYLQAKDCEALTGIPAATWRYWAHIGSGPASFKLGRRRVWRMSAVMAWIEAEEVRTQRGGNA
ncbi:helix-turn-helix transcriptional regulator [Nocardia amamiensis]|uniref:helix-turn-helix transcriptional regulator n=1 Tax=Nocardia amamiensis TaxID=404578 RepID=UPI0033FDF726